jgi:hypothetical protein
LKQILIFLCGVTICTLFIPHDAFAKNLSIELSESLDMASNDKKPKDTDTKKSTKDTKKSEKKETKKIKEKKKIKDIKKPKKIKKHNTVKNSINNIR